MRRKETIVGALTLAVTLVVVGATAAAYGDLSLGEDHCAQGASDSPAFAEFDLPNGLALRERFPGFGKSPQLDSMTGAVHVVAFAGTRTGIPVLGRLNGEAQLDLTKPLTNVACVVTASGDEWYFTDVPFDGYRPPS